PPETPVFDYISERLGLWFAIGSFGASIGLAIAILFNRTGESMNNLAGLVGATATLALLAVAEIGLSVKRKLERQFPEASWTKQLLKDE
ncbi:MAG: hypothetical protein ACRDKS_16470, partial [Actinomycetota bacterium]